MTADTSEAGMRPAQATAADSVAHVQCARTIPGVASKESSQPWR